MSLIDAFKGPCAVMDKAEVPDGEGGFTTAWREGAEFDAAIVRDTSLEARIAERDGLANTYTVTTSADAALGFHDVFKRKSDGQVFRVTSDGDDRRTPPVASFQFEQVGAEEWSLS